MSGRATALQRARKIREVLLDYGVPEVSIELLPGRPTSGDVWNALDPVSTMSHHIASKPTPSNPVPGLRLVKVGRLDLPGPLANGTAGVDLVYRILCLGLANHPGEGGSMVVSGPLGAFRIPKDVGRPYIWGTEYEGGFSEAVWDRVYQNRRTKKKMTFREFMGRANGGLTEAIWLPGISSRDRHPTRQMDLAGYHMEHKTWAPTRKIDRLGYTTEEGRNEIRRYKQFEEEDDVEYKDWSAKSKQNLLNDIMSQKITTRNRKGEKIKITVRQALARAANASNVTRQSEKDIIAAIEQADTDNAEGGE